MFDRYLLLYALVFSCVLSNGCVTGSRTTFESAQEPSQVDSSNALLKEEKFRLLKFLELNPQPIGLVEKVLDFSERCIERAEYDFAVEVLVAALPGTLDGPRRTKVRLLLAHAYRRKGDLESARVNLLARPLETLPWLTRETIYLRLAELDALSGNSSGQLGWLLQLRQRQDLKGEERNEQLFEEFFRGIPWEELEILEAQIEGEDFLIAQLLMRKAELAFEFGNKGLARVALESAEGLVRSFREKKRYNYLLALLSNGSVVGGNVLNLPSINSVEFKSPSDSLVGEGRIGVLLPLTGPYADVGEQSLKGILLAASVFDSIATDNRKGVELVVRDTAGDPAKVKEALVSLSTYNVSAVIGPVLGRESWEAAKHSSAFPFPLLSLSRREDLVGFGKNIFRFGLTSRAEVEVLVDYVFETLKLRKIGLLYPRDSYGRKVRSLFWDEVEKRGGKIVSVAGYNPGDTDFSEAVRNLVGYRRLDFETRQALVERRTLLREAKRKVPEIAKELRQEAARLLAPDGSVLPPIIRFEALFIPDTYEKVALIAPQLAFHGIKGVRLLGLSDWNHSDLIDVGGKYVGGSVFTSAYFGGSRHPALVGFTERYRETFAQEAGPFAAEAFDVTRLLLRAMQDTTGDISNQLRQVVVEGGISGVIEMGPDRNVSKRPHVLGVHRGRLISIDEEAFAPYIRVPSSEDRQSSRNLSQEKKVSESPQP